MRWPGKIKAGVESDAIVSWIDFFPTFLDLAGDRIPDNIDGKSFAKLLTGESETQRDIIFIAHSGDSEKNRSRRCPLSSTYGWKTKATRFGCSTSPKLSVSMRRSS